MATLSNVNVVKANATLRRFILSFCLGVAVFTALGLYLSQQVYQTSPSHPLLHWIGNGLLLTACVIELSLLAFGLWMGCVGTAALQQGCYPPSNSMVLCDTLLVTGWRATIKALAALMLSTVSLLGTLGLGLEIVKLLNL